MCYNEEYMDEEEDVEVVPSKKRCQRRNITGLKDTKQTEFNKIKQIKINNCRKEILEEKKICPKNNKKIKELEGRIKKYKCSLKKEFLVEESELN